jgi:hypothetical protein
MKSREFMPFHHSTRLVRYACALLLIAAVPVLAGETKLTETQREMIIRDFLAERPFLHRALPRGKAGVRVNGDKITPPEPELNQLVAQFGAVAKPGDRVKITAVRFEHHGVLFEINGGPVKRKSWRDRVSIDMGGVDPRTQAQPTDADVLNNSSGSTVFLELKDDVALTTAQMKDLLAPVLDFKAQTAAEAFQKSLPPKLAEAVKNHHALVGMDKQMVLYAMGRPPRRVRETKDGKEVEEWIYGAPPQDVEFIRFVDDKAVSIEDMKVSGEKRERTADEVGDLSGGLNASSEKHTHPDSMSAEEERRRAPTLLRPGEKQENPGAASRDNNPLPSPDAGSTPGPPDPGQSNPGNNRMPNPGSGMPPADSPN